MDKLVTLVLATARPIATCLVAGGLKALVDYQAAPKWTPALVDGGITALLMAGTMLGVGGAVAGARTAVAAQQSGAPPKP